jgi:hypothetical protein
LIAENEYQIGMLSTHQWKVRRNEPQFLRQPTVHCLPLTVYFQPTFPFR